MNRIFALVFLLFFNESVAAGDDPLEVQHLPKRLRHDAQEFYSKVREGMQEIQVIPADTPHTLLVHMYGNQDWSGHTKPCHRFLDYCIRTDGINIRPNIPADLPERDGIDYVLNDLPDNPLPLADYDEFRERFFDSFQNLAYRRNAFASFFLGVLHLGYLRGNAGNINRDAGYFWLFEAANGDYKRAIEFLIAHPTVPEIIPLDTLELKRDLMEHSTEALESFITDLDPTARAVPRTTLDLLEKSLEYQKGRIEPLRTFYEQLTPIIADILAQSKRRKFDGRKLVRDLVHDTVIYAVPTILTVHYLKGENALNITSYNKDLFQYKLIAYETLAGATWGFGRLLYNVYPLVSSSSCRLFCKGTIDASVTEETIVSESKLSALFITLFMRERIKDNFAPLRAVDLSAPLKKLFAKRLTGTAKPMSQVILENCTML